MHVWIQRGKTRNGDVASEEVELGDAIPHITLRWKLIIESTETILLSWTSDSAPCQL